MRKHSKKIALILILALTLVAAIPALAANTVVLGQYEIPDIQVVIPTDGEAVINPLKLPVAIKADDGTTVIGKLTTDPGQVATRPLIGYNMSEVDLSIGATVSGEPRGDFRLATAKPAASDTTKSGLIYLEVQASTTDLGYVLGQDANTSPATTVCGGLTGTTVLTALDAWSHTAYNDAANQLVVGTRPVEKSNMCEIAQATDTDGDGVLDTPAATGYFMARISGDVVPSPTSEWVERDGFKVNITWNIEPA